MLALTILEPWASLISTNKKHIETRTWNTKYRGKMYIHAGKGKVSPDLLPSLKRLNSDSSGLVKHPGYILASCNLIDCVQIDKNFIDEIQKNSFEYDAGVFDIGRYAWILDNINKLRVVLVN